MWMERTWTCSWDYVDECLWTAICELIGLDMKQVSCVHEFGGKESGEQWVKKVTWRENIASSSIPCVRNFVDMSWMNCPCGLHLVDMPYTSYPLFHTLSITRKRNYSVNMHRKQLYHGGDFQENLVACTRKLIASEHLCAKSNKLDKIGMVGETSCRDFHHKLSNSLSIIPIKFLDCNNLYIKQSFHRLE